MKPSEFWEYSIAEIYDIMESCYRRRETEAKQAISREFTLADAIAQNISTFIDKEAKIAKPWDYYPALFEDEKEKFEKMQLQDDLERRRDSMARYNRQRQEQGE